MLERFTGLGKVFFYYCDKSFFITADNNEGYIKWDETAFELVGLSVTI
jgi:hypothetical protein